MEEYFEGYLLDVNSFSLECEDEKLLAACCWLVDNNSTIRTTAINFDIPKTSLHRYIHNGRLRRLSFELYNCTVRILKKHLRNGGFKR